VSGRRQLSIALTLVVNTLLLPRTAMQLKAEIHRQLACWTCACRNCRRSNERRADTLAAVQQGALTLQKLLRFTTMRDAHFREHQAAQLRASRRVASLIAE